MREMRQTIARAALATCVLACCGAYAGDGPLERAAVTLGVADIQSLEFEARGHYFQFTQAPAPELPWPAFEVDAYVATLDFERRAVHAKYHRVQVQEPGRARPHAEATMDQCDTIDDEYCFDANPIYCDGNEDCAGDSVCCYIGYTAYCIDAATCAAHPGATMCHGDEECPVGVTCCEIITGRPYAACGLPACQ